MFITRSQAKNTSTGDVIHYSIENNARAREHMADLAAGLPNAEHALYEHPGTYEDVRDCIDTHWDVALCPAAKFIF